MDRFFFLLLLDLSIIVGHREVLRTLINNTVNLIFQLLEMVVKLNFEGFFKSHSSNKRANFVRYFGSGVGHVCAVM